ncbi:glycogen synthase GlgA [Planococcus salinarum]|uniref:glycogen synthase GlgA n=1 Tax=Planococcus salinarum TaxID=622695 RepID=UPI000E3C9996|nr:glycogen synthase GlgA [Planococcus salinarum]TAA72026.1 glycogen synthase GlgA [Planococcus salinarum]
MKIVMAAAECVPFAKTGGLADVIGALPKELADFGHDVTVFMPKYALIPEKFVQEFSLLEEIAVPFSGEQKICGVYEYTNENVRYLFLGNREYYERSEIYGQADDGERFGFFNAAVLTVMVQMELEADIIHVHDWHAAVIPFLLKTDSRFKPLGAAGKTVLTIHNLQFQGSFQKSVFTDGFGLEETQFEAGAIEWNGRYNMLKTGILYADKVTTVSPSYRDEIMTSQYGEGLEQVLQKREEDLVGILNGLDTDFYNPATDLAIEMEFDQSSIEGKAVNKRSAQSMMGLPVKGNVPLTLMVSRLAGQKGIDILEDALPKLLESHDMQFVLLGSGEAKFEEFFRGLARQHPEKVAVRIGFDENLAHQLYAGADIFLMPSHFEPCGLSQLISMRYGTVPVANKTGGLKDTIVEYDRRTKRGNGFLSDFARNSPFAEAVERALTLYQESEHWDTLKQNGMKADYSWKQAAGIYAELYQKLVKGR